MIHTWYHPRRSGDFRLEAGDDEKSCRLRVTNPTPAELDQLGDFLAKARQRKWISKAAGVSEQGETVLEIKTDVSAAGRILIGEERMKKGVLTSVRSTAGAVSVVVGNDADELAAATEKADADAAVTTPRPTCCCPNNIPGPEVRASDVLRAFCTQQQWDDWQEHGYLYARGCYTGHLYRLAHRNSAIGCNQRKPTWDMTDNQLIHCHLRHLPPPEEVLAIKQCVEHAEHWMRNPSSALGAHRNKLHNPFMSPGRQGWDGIPDTAFMNGFGAGLRSWLRAFGFGEKEKQD